MSNKKEDFGYAIVDTEDLKGGDFETIYDNEEGRVLLFATRKAAQENINIAIEDGGCVKGEEKVVKVKITLAK